MLEVYQKYTPLKKSSHAASSCTEFPTVYEFCKSLFSESKILVNGINELLPVLSTFSSDLSGNRKMRSKQYIVA